MLLDHGWLLSQAQVCIHAGGKPTTSSGPPIHTCASSSEALPGRPPRPVGERASTQLGVGPPLPALASTFSVFFLPRVPGGGGGGGGGGGPPAHSNRLAQKRREDERAGRAGNARF